MKMKSANVWRFATLCGLVVTLFLGTSRVEASDSNILFPSAQAPVENSAAASVPYPFGVQVLASADSPNYANLLAQAQAFGAKWARVNFGWSQVQPTAPTTPGCGNCDWTYPDKLFGALAAQNLTPIITIAGNPTWAGKYAEGPVNSANLPDLANFISAVAERYPNAQYFEFYNEPDDWTSVKQPAPPPYDHRGWGGHGADYAAMLKSVYDVLHPGGAIGVGGIPRYVVFGGIAYEPKWQFPGRPEAQAFDNNFVKSVLKAAPGKIFDVMNYHYYAALAPYHTPHNILGKAVELSAAFPQLKGMPFVVTEMGTPYFRRGARSYSHDGASNQIVKIYTQMRSGESAAYNLNILAGAWFTLDHYDEHSTPRQSWGLLDENGAPWPLETSAYSTVAKELANASFSKHIVSPGIDGYRFKLADGSNLQVLWANNKPVKRSFKATSLRWLDRSGNATNVTDNGAGDLNPRVGMIGLIIPARPVYVEFK